MPRWEKKQAAYQIDEGVLSHRFREISNTLRDLQDRCAMRESSPEVRSLHFSCTGLPTNVHGLIHLGFSRRNERLPLLRCVRNGRAACGGDQTRMLRRQAPWRCGLPAAKAGATS